MTDLSTESSSLGHKFGLLASTCFGSTSTTGSETPAAMTKTRAKAKRPKSESAQAPKFLRHQHKPKNQRPRCGDLNLHKFARTP